MNGSFSSSSSLRGSREKGAHRCSTLLAPLQRINTDKKYRTYCVLVYNLQREKRRRESTTSSRSVQREEKRRKKRSRKNANSHRQPNPRSKPPVYTHSSSSSSSSTVVVYTHRSVHIHKQLRPRSATCKLLTTFPSLILSLSLSLHPTYTYKYPHQSSRHTYSHITQQNPHTQEKELFFTSTLRPRLAVCTQPSELEEEEREEGNLKYTNKRIIQSLRSSIFFHFLVEENSTHVTAE